MMPPQAALRQGLKSPSGFRPAMDFQHLRSDLELLVPVVKRFILVSPLLRFLQLQFIPLFYLTAQSFAFPLHSLYIPFIMLNFKSHVFLVEVQVKQASLFFLDVC